MQVLDSFIDAALSLSNKRAGDELLGMIVRYLRTGQEPSPRTEAQRAVLIAIRPSMDNSKARAEGGRRGMANRWNDNSGGNSSHNSPHNSSHKTRHKPPDNEEEEEKEKEEPSPNGDGKKKRPRFTPPTSEEVRAYAEAKGLLVDAERFVDYYASNGWRVGRNPMRDWRATVRNWARKPSSEKEKGGEYDEYFDLR